MNTLCKLLLTIALAACLVLPALAADKVIMKDGRVITGDILEQTDTYVKIKITLGTVAKTEVLFMGDIAEIEHDAAGGGDAGGNNDNAGPASDNTGGPELTSGARVEEGSGRSANNPGVIVLPLSGMVGIEFRAEEIEKVAEEADRILQETGKSPVIVLHIESGGGLMSEMYEIHDTLVEVKKRHRVVAWIKEAISAACATALHCDEIYFMTEGNAGAMTGYAGTTALQGEAREKWLRDAGNWAVAGGRSPYIAVAMIGNEFLLSYDKDPVTGEVTWYNDLSGEYVLSRPHQNLSFTKSTALHSGFADGWADTTGQLADAMQLPEWYEASNFGRRLHSDWVSLLDRGRSEIPKAYGMIQVWQNSGLGEVERIGKIIREYEKLLQWWDKTPELCTYEVRIEPKEAIERQIEALKRQLADMRRRDR